MPWRLRRARRARGRCHRRRPMESKIYFTTNLMYANNPSARSKPPIPLQAHKALSARKGDAGAAYEASHSTRSNYSLIEVEWRVRPARTPMLFRIAVGLRAIRRTACYSRSSRSSHTVRSASALWEWCVRRSCSRPRVGTGNSVLPGRDLSQPQTALGICRQAFPFGGSLHSRARWRDLRNRRRVWLCITRDWAVVARVFTAAEHSIASSDWFLVSSRAGGSLRTPYQWLVASRALGRVHVVAWPSSSRSVVDTCE